MKVIAKCTLNEVDSLHRLAHVNNWVNSIEIQMGKEGGAREIAATHCKRSHSSTRHCLNTQKAKIEVKREKKNQTQL